MNTKHKQLFIAVILAIVAFLVVPATAFGGNMGLAIGLVVGAFLGLVIPSAQTATTAAAATAGKTAILV